MVVGIGSGGGAFCVWVVWIIENAGALGGCILCVVCVVRCGLFTAAAVENFNMGNSCHFENKN